MNKNTDSTRYYSDKMEKSVCDGIGGEQTPNSGAGVFRKGDVIVKDASLLIECKTVTADKKSFSIKQDWIEKNKEEAFRQRLSSTGIAFNFGPNQQNYYVIDEKLMKLLVEKLSETEEI